MKKNLKEGVKAAGEATAVGRAASDVMLHVRQLLDVCVVQLLADKPSSFLCRLPYAGRCVHGKVINRSSSSQPVMVDFLFVLCRLCCCSDAATLHCGYDSLFHSCDMFRDALRTCASGGSIPSQNKQY
jgi:hypothetical protein